MKIALSATLCAALCIVANAGCVGVISIVVAINRLISANFHAIAAGDLHSLIIWKDHTVATSGINFFGQLGDGSNKDKDRFEQVAFTMRSNAVAVAAGVSHSVLLKQDGSVWTTGCNLNGQLGDGSNKAKHIFKRVISKDATAVVAGGDHTMVRKRDGSVWSVGNNFYGQLADGTRTNKNHFVRVTHFGALKMAAGSHHSMVLQSDGTVWVSGRNHRGQLGDGTTISKARFIYVMPNIMDIAAGGHHSLLLKEDGTVLTAGCNKFGQLGHYRATSSSKFTKISHSISEVVAVAAGSYHSMLLAHNGSVWVVGYNNYGQLGDGSTTTRTSFKKVISSGAIGVTGGLYHTLVAKKNGNVLAAGWNKYGQFGNGYKQSRKHFVKVGEIGFSRRNFATNTNNENWSRNYMTRNLMLPYSDVATASTFEHINYICIFS